MGCFGSKAAEPRREREAAAPAQGSGAVHVPRSAAIGIGPDGKEAAPQDGAQNAYGRSWTDERLAEQALLKKILEKAQMNFIDVTQQPAMLDEKDVEERLTKYNKSTAVLEPSAAGDTFVHALEKHAFLEISIEKVSLVCEDREQVSNVFSRILTVVFI
jgi:hypothetical protein